MSIPKQLPVTARYLLGILIVSAAVLLRWALIPILGGGTEFITVFPAVAFVAVVLGQGPGVLAGIVGIVTVETWLIPDDASIDSLIRAILVLTPAFYLGSIGRKMRQAEASALREASFARQELTERKRVEDELRSSRELLAVTLSSIGDGVIVTDLNCSITFMNPEAESLTGWKIAEALGQPLSTVFNIIHEKTREPAENPAEKVLRIGSVVGLANHTLLIARDGRETPIDDSGAPVRGQDGEMLGVVLVFRDFTEARNSKEALQNSERLYRAIGESIDYGVWVCDPQGKNIYASESFLKLVGLTQEECSAFGWGKVLHPDDAERTVESWKDCVRSGGRWDREHRFRGVDGNWHEILARGVQVKDADGNVIYWAGINLDISKLKNTERSLVQALSHLNSHMENSPLGIVEWDADFIVTRWGGEAERMFGWSPEEILGRNIGELNMIHPEDVPKVEAIMVDMVSGKKPSNMNANRNYRKDGSVMNCEWYNSALYDDRGRLISVLSLVLDVTRREVLEEELLRAKVAAESASKAKSDFLARMSHELRTPMNGSIGMIELALRQGLGGKAKEYLELAKVSSNALLDIINELLDLARIEAGRLELDREPFSPAETARGVVDFLFLMASEKGLYLVPDILPGVAESVLGDKGRLRQVLVNLVSNAIKFTNEGGVTLRLSPSGKQTRKGFSAIDVFVADTGIGIGPEHLTSIFDSFSQATTLTHTRYGGTGLGLSISRQLVGLMGGELKVESKPGVGSVFSFTLEYEKAATTKPGGRPAVSRPPRTPVSGLNILLAEDNPINRLFAQSLIEEEGHTVTVAEDGREALTALQKGGFDLVLLDVQMPHLDGLEVAGIIREGGVPTCARDIPIIAMTAHAFAEDRERFLTAGMNDYLAKPIDLRELDRLLSHWSNHKSGTADKPGGAGVRRAGLERARKRIKELFERLPEAKVWQLLEMSVEQFEPALMNLSNLAATNDHKELSREAHRLRGTWTVVFGTDRMIEISHHIEKWAEQEKLQGIGELLTELRHEAGILQEFLREEKDNHRAKS